ncbi:RebB family R body protein [Segnochrobactrum spirostomi]|nr:RebB family R body protein [Segnochrobactrum spirostomi]
MSSTVNPQVIDGLSSTNSSVVGSAPAVALSIFYQAAGQAYSLTMQNAASNQQNLNALNPTIVANALRAITTA